MCNLKGSSITRINNKDNCFLNPSRTDNIDDNLSDVNNEMSGGLKRKNSSVTEGVNEATDVAANNNNIQEKSAEKQSSPNKRIKVCKT